MPDEGRHTSECLLREAVQTQERLAARSVRSLARIEAAKAQIEATGQRGNLTRRLLGKSPLGARGDSVRTEAPDLRGGSVRTTVPDVAAPVDSPAERRRKLVGERIRLAREEARLTQVQAACRLERTRHHYSDWERGINEPTPENKLRLARLFGVPVSRFYVMDDGDA
jgi:DNA-binding XRE family transcriptional regulator